VILHVDQESAVPVFEQLRVQLERLIASGQLRPGSRLPTIRDLASDLGLARGTVNKVYEALARDGWVQAAGRHGTVVLERATPAATVDELREAAETLALVSRQLGASPEQAHAALDRALRRWADG